MYLLRSCAYVCRLKQSKLVTTHVVRLKLFRLKAEGGQKGTIAILLAETSDSCTKHGFKMRFFLTVFSLQPIHLSSYVNCQQLIANN